MFSRLGSLAIGLGLLLGLSTTINAQGAIAGSATDGSGAPLVGAVVVAFPDFSGFGFGFGGLATTDTNGDYEIGGLDAGDYTVRCIHAGQFSSPVTATVTDGMTTTVDFVIGTPDTGTLNGTVTNSVTGDPVADAWVLVYG
ncbi:MAG: carboxypeptidase regulatory-like domain-containing protein, partial [Planctomycetes bacterium]|nr:carboxypeptidase regulatory-like domain-containing protein [Planctomycetota bacterium]